MSFDAARKALKMAEVALDGLDFIETLTHVGGDKAEAALKVAHATIAALKDGFAGKLDPQAVIAQIDTLRDGLKANDDAADKALAERFKA